MRYAGSISLLLVVVSLLCELPQNPRNINNASFRSETLTKIPERTPLNSVYTCTVTVSFPEFIDSFAVYQSIDTVKQVKVAGDTIGSDSIFAFTVSFPRVASYTLCLYLYKAEMVDSVTHTTTVFSTSPLATTSPTIVEATPGDSVVLRFIAQDPDSNLLEYTLSREGNVVEKKQLLASERAVATISTVLPKEYILALHDTSVYFVFEITDEDGQTTSPTVLCTLLVRDTVFPSIILLPPLDDSLYTVTNLPDTLRIVVHDNWGIDSVTFGGGHLLVAQQDTLDIVVSKLDSGITVDSIKAWDRAGNLTSQEIRLEYTGPKVYPPKIASIVQTISEGGMFDTVYLDKKVTITDTAPNYTVQDLIWSFSIDTIDSGMVVYFDSTERTLYIEGPADELFHDRIAALSLTVIDPNGGFDHLHGATFIMVEKNDPPTITLTGQQKLFGTAFDTISLDTCGFDPERNTHLEWQIDKGNYFVPESLFTVTCPKGPSEKEPFASCFLQYTGKIRIVRDSTLFTTQEVKTIYDTLLFTLKSIAPGDTAEVSKRIPFTWYQTFIPLDTIPLKSVR